MWLQSAEDELYTVDDFIYHGDFHTKKSEINDKILLCAFFFLFVCRVCQLIGHLVPK